MCRCCHHVIRVGPNITMCMLINYQHCWFTTTGLLPWEGCCSADNLLITAAGLFTGDYCCGGYYLLVHISYQHAKPADSSQGFATEWMSICGLMTQADNHPQVVKKDNHYVIGKGGL